MKPLYWRLSTAAIMLCAPLAWMYSLNVGAEDAKPATTDSATTPAETEKADSPAAKSDDSGSSKKWYRGSVSAGFDGLWGRHGQQDVDFVQSLQFQIDPPQNDKLHLRGSMWMIENVGPSPSINSGLRDIDSAYDSTVVLRPSYLYVDVDDLWKDSTLRIGRQRILEGSSFNRIDGVYFKQRLNLWDWYVFGGTRATFYEDNFETPVVGGGMSYSPSPNTKIALDTYYSHENFDVHRPFTFHGPVAAFLNLWDHKDVENNVDDLSVALSAWHTVNEHLVLFGRFNWYNDTGNELLLSATGYFAEPWDITYEVAYRHQFDTVHSRTNDETAYYRILGSFKAYDNFLLALHRPLCKHITLSLEAEIHETHSGNEFNRDYQRFAAILGGDKLFGPAALDAKIGLERWHVSEGEGTWAVVGEVGKRWDKLKVFLGTDYQRYEDRLTEYNDTFLLLDMARVWFAPGMLQGYNPFVLFFGNYAVQEHQNIYSVYLKANWAIRSNQDIQAKVMYEEDNGPYSPVWRVQADYTIRF